MLLLPEQAVIRNVVVKQKFDAVGRRVFWNRHDVLSNAEIDQQVARQVLDHIGLAEQHILMHDVSLLFRVAYEDKQNNFEGLGFRCFASFNTVQGGRSIDTFDVPIEYEVALLMRRLAPYGRAGRLCFRGVLRERDVLREADGFVGMRGDYDGTGLNHNFFNSFMLQSPLQHILVERDAADEWPQSWRPILSWNHAQAVKLKSIADAQGRKTIKAQPYGEAARGLAEKIRDLGARMENLRDYAGAKITPEQLDSVISLLSIVKGDATYLEDYWGEGVELAIAPCWRPGAGLDPHTLRARQNVAHIIQCCEALGYYAGQLAPDEDGNFEQGEFTDLLEWAWRIAAHYVLLMERERWTGTPIPHPNAPGACN